MSVLMHVTADAEKETKQKRRLRRKKPFELKKAGIFADEAFTAKELVLQNLSNLSPDSAGFGKKAA